MTLNEFIATKPKELRLGQYFWNTYFKHQHMESAHMKASNKLYYETDDNKAVDIIKGYMELYQWKEL